MPGAGDPRAWDRYAYVKNSPIVYSDPTGHDPNNWFSPWNAYVTGWNNASVALSIVTNSNTSVTQRLLPAAYLTAWAGAHVMLITGTALLGCSAITTCSETVAGGGEIIDAVSNEVEKTSNMPYSNPNSRPSYAPGQIEQVWDNAMDENGQVFDPYSGEELQWDKSEPRNGQWDMGHNPGQTYKELWQDYRDGKIDHDTFIDEYQDPNNYRPQSPYTNRSRRWDE